MTCPQCSCENPAAAKFCGACGARLEAHCPACQAPNPPANRFYHECGGPLAGGPPPASSSPQTYTPKHLVEKILTSRGAIEGERKQVTVLFADIKGSMELLEGRDPEEARQILDPALRAMMDAVHLYEGTVNQVMGDGIMALFGAPVAHEDHAVRACYAALRMQEAVGRYGEEIGRSRGIPVRIRVGLNSGEVVVRSIGSDLHMDYSAIGQTTHLAARMEQLAAPGTIRLTADTFRLAEGFVQAKPLGPVPVKGLADPVEAYELVGAGPIRTRLQAAAARGLTRFVGRQAELEALRQAQDRAAAGRGQVVAIVGEAGVGKSRLFWEFTRSDRTRGCLALESRSVAYGQATAYLPVIELLKTYFRIEDRDDGRAVREKVAGRLAALDEALAPTIPAIRALLDVPVEDAQWQALDPPQRRQRTLEAVKRLLLRESQAQPLLVIFEDLHWIDSETQALLDSLIESLPAARLLLLVNYRPEYQHGWGSKTYYTQLRMDPLPSGSAAELLQALLGDAAGLEPLQAHLIERTEGNPFFLEECVRTLAETQVLVGERGGYRLAKPLQTVQVPATAQAILAARIDRLPPQEKCLLQCAAVIGKDVPFLLLQAIADLAEEELRRGLAHLQAAEFLYETSLFPEPEYTFKHALTHEVAYASVLQAQRRQLHARIGLVMEEMYAGRLEERLEKLAHHFVRGEVWERAVRALRQAGAKGVALCVDREAVALYEQALEALARLPESPEWAGQGIDLRLELRAPLWRLGRLDRLFELFRDAEALARSLGDPRRLEKIYAFLVQYYWATAAFARAIEYGEHCLEAGGTLKDLALQITGNLYLGHAYNSLGDYARAVEVLARNVELLEGERAAERFGLSGLPSVVSGAWAVACLAELGEFQRGLELAGRAIRVAEAADHPYSLAAIRTMTGFLHILKGEPEAAIGLLEPALQVSEEKKFAGWTILSATALGVAYGMAGRPGDGIPIIAKAIRLHETAGALVNRGRHWGQMAETLLRAGRVSEARRAGEEALGFSQAQGQRGDLAWGRWILGEVAAREGPERRAEAQGNLEEAVRLAEALGMRPLLARALMNLAELHLNKGEEAEARAMVTRAAELFTATGMERDRDGARALLAGRENTARGSKP